MCELKGKLLGHFVKLERGLKDTIKRNRLCTLKNALKQSRIGNIILFFLNVCFVQSLYYSTAKDRLGTTRDATPI